MGLRMAAWLHRLRRAWLAIQLCVAASMAIRSLQVHDRCTVRPLVRLRRRNVYRQSTFPQAYVPFRRFEQRLQIACIQAERFEVRDEVG